MKLRFLTLLPAFCLIALAAPVASAQDLPFSIEFTDTTGVVTPGPFGYKDFHFTITNNTKVDQEVQITRTVNNLPNGSWSSNICTDATCYPTTVDNPEPVRLLALQPPVDIKLTITGGTSANEVGIVELKFSSGPFGPGVTKQFRLSTATSSIASESRPAVRIDPIPNPASSSTLLPAKLSSANGLSVRLYDPLGRLAADLSSGAQLRDGGVRIDLGGVAVGTYFYQLDADGYRGTGTVVVAR